MAGMFSQEHTERIKTLFYKFDEQGAGFIKIFETALIFNALGERVSPTFIARIYTEITPKKINDEADRRLSIEPESSEPEIDIHKLFAILQEHFRKKELAKQQNEMKNSFAALGGGDNESIDLNKLTDLFTSFQLQIRVADLAGKIDPAILNTKKINFNQFSQMFSD